jgi:surfeit locus 1 family protein
MLRSFLTPRWILTTLLVIVAVGVMARLGFWQLERLEQRRAFNARVQAQIDSPPLDLAAALADGSLTPAQLPDLEYRSVVLRGEYRPAEQLIVRNQVWQGLPGSHLLTPLVLAGTDYAILVDRGWIPMAETDPAEWQKYNQAGPVEVRGSLQKTQDARRFGAPDPTPAPGVVVPAWNAVRLARIAPQISAALLPAYVLAAPTGNPDDQLAPPYAAIQTPDLSEGSHMNYALQWFSFAAVLGLGYPYFVKKQLS